MLCEIRNTWCLSRVHPFRVYVARHEHHTKLSVITGFPQYIIAGRVGSRAKQMPRSQDSCHMSLRVLIHTSMDMEGENSEIDWGGEKNKKKTNRKVWKKYLTGRSSSDKNNVVMKAVDE